MRHLLFISSLLLFISQDVRAQDYEHWIRFAKEAQADQDPLGAVRYYEEAFAIDSTEQELQYALAEAYRLAGKDSKALRLYLKVYSKERGRFFPQGAARIASLKMRQGDYDTAIKFWKRALRWTDVETEKAHIREQMNSCAYALSNPLTNTAIQVEPLSAEINSSDGEFGAYMGEDNVLYFSSLRGAYGEDQELLGDDPFFTRIYSSHYDQYGFTTADTVGIVLEDAEAHLAYPVYSGVADQLYLAVHTSTGSYLAKAVQVADSWIVTPLLAEAYRSEGSDSHPFAFEVEGTHYLLFSRKPKSGNGKYDIYLGKVDAEGLHDVMPLSGEVNTDGNEVTPFYDSLTGRLYFSSDAHPGYGGQDIFWALLDLDSYHTSKPRNMGLPMNSPYDDYGYRSSSVMQVFNSNRMADHEGEHCCHDIYRVTEHPIDSTEAVQDDHQVPEHINRAEDLNAILPIKLYFHNDIPDPGSNASATQVSYETTVAEYMALEEKYISQYSSGLSDSASQLASEEMQRFFAESIQGEFDRLDKVMHLLHERLEAGERIEIAIKGYASPLAQDEYNKKLTQRRIACLLNYMQRVGDGMLLPYLDDSDQRLTILPIPYGEDESEPLVSDNPQDAKNAIYSLAAARERRVEILRISGQ